MKEQQSFRLCDMGDLEDSVCRASHSAELAFRYVETLTDSSSEGGLKLPLSDEERELLYFAASEAFEHAAKARYQFYKLGESTS